MAEHFVGVPAVYPKLLELRKSTTAEFKPSKHWTDDPKYKLRYYQVIGALHMMLLDRMVLGDGTGLGKCVSDETYIPTSRGLIKVGSLFPIRVKEDEFYKSPKMEILSTIGALQPSALYDSGIKEGLRITTDNGYSLLGLGHHPILKASESSLYASDYCRLQDLKNGDYICINRKGLFAPNLFKLKKVHKNHLSNTKIYQQPEYLMENLAELIGFYVSEGNSSSKWAFDIEQHEKENNSRIRFLLYTLFGYKENNCKSYNKTVKVNSVLIQECLASTGMVLKDTSGDKQVPEAIMQSPKSIIRAFLRAYFEGDGGVEKDSGGVSCSSKSEELINQIQLLLLMFGIVSKRKRKMVKVGKERRPYWILYFFGEAVDTFREEIGFVSVRKTTELNGVSNKDRNTNKDIIPYGHLLLRRAMDDIIAHLRNQPSQHGFSTRGSGWRGLVGQKYKDKFEAIMYQKRHLTYSCLKSFISLVESKNLQRVVSNFGQLKEIVESHYFFDKVVSIKKEQARFVDFSVPLVHNFTGGGFINHNTIECLAAYSFLLERDPTLKMLVVCTKSAMGQWEEEIGKFTRGITCRVISIKFDGLEGLPARRAQYNLFKENVMIINYAPIIEEYEFIRQALGPNTMFIFDECFDYHTPVLLENGETELIGKIVCQKMNVRVMSYNKSTGKVEPKKVVNFFRTPAIEWVKVKSALNMKGKGVNCTPSHSFYTTRGEKPASDLKPGDQIYIVDKGVDDTQKQVILGTLLGDGSITNYKRFRDGKRSMITFMQSSMHSSYFFFKARVFSDLVASVQKQKSGWNKVPMWYGFLSSNPILMNYLTKLGMVDVEISKRVIPKGLFEQVTPIALAIWYCDDGSINDRGRGAQLSTHGFTEEENYRIASEMQEKWGIKVHVYKDKRVRKRCKDKGNFLCIFSDSAGRFFTLIHPYVPIEMGYKLPVEYRKDCGKYWETYSYRPFWDIATDTVTSVEPQYFKSGTNVKYKYNIEVEDNHNYFAGSFLVSNCTMVKNRKAKTHVACQMMTAGARRVYGLSASIIKNGLEEVFGIYEIVVPGLFGRITKFKETYCQQRMMKLMINGKIRMIPKITGYKNLPAFKQVLDPYFLIRRKEDVAKELPKLISRKVILEMYPEQKELYRQALAGIIYEEKIKNEYYEIWDKVRNGDTSEETKKKYDVLKDKYEKFLTPEGRKRGKLAALTYCQMVSNGPALLNQPGESSKDDELLRLFKEELVGEKVIVFTRFKSGIPYYEVLCERNRLKYAKITGDCTDRERDQARIEFQTSKDCNIIFITTAGSMSLNLQAAGTIIFMDTPWSYGDLMQTIGRAQRIGSIQDHILLIHMANKGTIDIRVLNKVTGKKDLSDQILGDTAVGALDFTVNEDKVVDGLFQELMEDAEEESKSA